MKRSFRLTSSTDFQRVRRSGKTYAHPLFVLAVSANGKNRSRFGIVAGKAFTTAVRRNRAKRRLRAALLPFLSAVIPGWDVVVVARRACLEAEFSRLQLGLGELLKRAQLLPDSYDDRHN